MMAPTLLVRVPSSPTDELVWAILSNAEYCPMKSNGTVMYTFHPLAGKTAFVTGVSRRRGIGYSVASKLAELGANVVIQHYRAHDLDQPWGADDLESVTNGIRATLIPDAVFAEIGADLARDDAAADVFQQAESAMGPIDILVCNHAKSGDDGSIFDLTADRLDTFWRVNTRSTLLLTAEFARRHAPYDASPRRPGELVEGSKPYSAPQGHVFWMTSGQMHGPMRGEVAYAASKASLAGITPTVAAELLEFGIILNTINPGPVNTGYMDRHNSDRSLLDIEKYLATTPFGRVGEPRDPAELIGWLATSAGSWVVGQVLTSDGGFGLQRS